MTTKTPPPYCQRCGRTPPAPAPTTVGDLDDVPCRLTEGDACPMWGRELPSDTVACDVCPLGVPDPTTPDDALGPPQSAAAGRLFAAGKPAEGLDRLLDVPTTPTTCPTCGQTVAPEHAAELRAKETT